MKSSNPLPAWGLFAVLVACAITFYLLVPGQKRLLARLVQDGKAQRALDVLRSTSPTEIAKDPEFYELMRLRLSRQLLDPKDQAGVVAQIEAALRSAGRFPGSRDYLAEVVESVSLLNDCARALKLVAPYLKTLSGTARRSLVESMVRNALASDMPEVAAETYEDCLRPFPPSETNLVEAVRLWRGAANPDQAIQVLENFEQQSGKGSAALGPMLAELKFGLLREVGRNGEAFDLAFGLGSQSGNEASRQKWVHYMQATADNPDQRRMLLKAYRQIVQTNPADAETWRLIADMSVASADLDMAKEALQKLIRLKPADGAIQKQLAQLHEWDDEPGLAFDLYVKLAGQKDAAAVDRLIALNPGLYRDKDVLRLLRGLSGDAQQSRHRLTLARLLTKHGEYAEAYSLYRDHLQREPEDTAVMQEYAETLKRQQSYEAALAVWRSLQKLKPEDEGVRGQIAEVHYLLGDFENSLLAYQQLAKRSTDLAALRKYCTLAESLGDFQSLSEALAREMELKKQTAPEDFIKLAYISNLLGADAKRQEWLERGLILFPDSDALRIQLSVLLVEKRERNRALLVMSRSHNLKTDLDALRLYLELLIGNGKYDDAEKFLKTGINEKHLNAQSIVFLQALVHEGNQNDAAAERIHQKLYREHPEERSYALTYLRTLIRLGKTREARRVLQPLLAEPTPEILREASQVHAELGDYKEAEKLQAQLMALPGKVRFQDWTYLGDIRYSAGNRSAARRAYRQALASAEINFLSQPP